MSFQFAIYYLFNKTLQVESTSLIVGNLDQLNQVTSQPDLDSDDDWFKIRWPTRKEPEKTVAAKVLLFGDSFKDLVTKNNLFILGKDIWTEEESMGEKKRQKKMLETNVVAAKKARLAKPTKIKDTARNQMLENLKISLSQKRVQDTQDHHTSSEDEFPQHLHCVKQRKTLKAARPKPPTPDHHTNSDDATDIGSPPCSDHHSRSDDATMIWSQSQPDVQMVDNSTSQPMVHQMDQIMASLRELPEMIKVVKECVQCVQALMPSSGGTPSSTTSSSVSDIEIHPLAGSEVTVSKRAFQRLNRSRMTIFAQELAVLVFTKDVLAQSTLTGKSGNGGPPKAQLDLVKVQAITDAVLLEFPQTTASEVRAAIRRKCNNEQFSQKHHNV
ncbi:uncharacterized protein LOC130415833 isoform X1 [Triplophysa dalaica]|uniref:uncharacterized protein LOC130415833 isoform X1 n=1 Tax=Triplophysa dalaica TaxID=1582913 RepID=UPI0024DFF623|nr:uncharacterized protein LOC130415833 isoform X1 [Triplophysa dalaica]